MIRRPAIAFLLGLIASPASVSGEEAVPPSFDLIRLAELPAHRALMRAIGEENGRLSDFTTDGCSGGMSAGWALIADDFPELAPTEDGALPWNHCCVTHDRAYHAAGASTDADASFDARLDADKALRVCVESTGELRKAEAAVRLGMTETQIALGYQLLARNMYNAVRLGGGPCSGLPWRWGYGYPNCWAFLP